MKTMLWSAVLAGLLGLAPAAMARQEVEEQGTIPEEQSTRELPPVPRGTVVTIPKGKVADVKPAKKGYKDTGGAVAVDFDRIASPDGREAPIQAGFTKVATGSGQKKGAIVGGSVVGGAILGKILGGSAKRGAILGGAAGAAGAAATRGREAVINEDEEVVVAIEKPARTTDAG